MNFKTTGVLLALLVVVLAVWLVVPRAEQPQTQPAPPTTFEETTAIFDPQPKTGDILRVVIERPNKPRIVFSRQPKPDDPEQLDKWQALEPLAAPVLDYMVDGLISTFTALRSRARFEPGSAGAPGDADAGLAPPVATVTLSDKNQKEYRIEIGQKAPVSADTYVRVAGTIHIASRDLWPQVKKEFHEYRDKRLCAVTPADAVRVELTAEGQRYRFSRGSDGAWVIDEPVKAYAETDQVMALLRKISGLRAQDFVEEASGGSESYGVDQPYLTASVTTETKRKLPPAADASETQPAEPQYETVTTTHGVVIGGFADMKQERRYAKPADQDWLATVNQKDVQDLVPDLLKLRDPRITRIKAADIVALELTAEGQTVRLTKADGVWQGSGDLAELELPAVTDVLQALEDLSALEYLVEPGDLTTYGLADPRAVVSVTVAGAVEPVSLRVGDLTKSGRNAYVLREGQQTVFVVSAAQANRLVVSPLSLRSRQILSSSPDQICRLDVRRDERRYVLERVDQKWQFVEPPGLPVEPAAIRTLVNDLARLRARRAVGKSVGGQDDARFGLDQPLVVVEFDLAEPTSPPATQPEGEAMGAASEPTRHVLRVGRQKTVAYARLDDDPFVYELDQTIYEVLTGELINRKLFDFEAGEVTGLVIVAPGGTLEFVKEKDEWKYVPDPYAPLAQSKLKELADAIAGLRVEMYLAYRDGDFAETGLFSAPVTVSIRLTGGRMANLKISQEVQGQLPRLAGWVEEKRIFRLRQADCQRLLRGLDYYLKSEAAEPAEPEDEPEE